jgi:carbonic anhydrase
MEKIKRLFLENRAWAKSKLLLDESYFENMAKDQTPEYLWIGCSDSRVPPSEITNTDPGEMFVHRNIANLVVHTDMNLLSVVQFAVEYLKVKHVIVCGHYNCGGVKAAMGHQSLGLLNNWIRNIKDTYSLNEQALKAVPTETERLNLLVELNVKDQVKNLMHTSIIQKAWKDNQSPHLHGWVYDLKTGLLKELVTVNPGTFIEDAYRYEV